ncbi:MAG: SH3 domain protein [Alphaproteobacteria bacterium]|jgi:SH3 domain protein
MQMPAYFSIIFFTILLSGLSGYSQAQTPQQQQPDVLVEEGTQYKDSEQSDESEERLDSEGGKQPNDQNGEFRWVSDDLFTYLHAGPGNDYRLLGSVTAGTQIQLLQVDRENGYAEVIDNRQRTGWIEIKFVSRNQSIRDDVTDLQASLTQRDESLASIQTELNAVMQNLNTFDAQKTKLNRQITQQLEDIARLNEQLERRERANNMQWFTRGAMLGVIALLIGYILGLFGRKRKSNDRLM